MKVPLSIALICYFVSLFSPTNSMMTTAETMKRGGFGTGEKATRRQTTRTLLVNTTIMTAGMNEREPSLVLLHV